MIFTEQDLAKLIENHKKFEKRSWYAGFFTGIISGIAAAAILLNYFVF